MMQMKWQRYNSRVADILAAVVSGTTDCGVASNTLTFQVGEDLSKCRITALPHEVIQNSSRRESDWKDVGNFKYHRIKRKPRNEKPQRVKVIRIVPMQEREWAESANTKPSSD